MGEGRWISWIRREGQTAGVIPYQEDMPVMAEGLNLPVDGVPAWSEWLQEALSVVPARFGGGSACV